MNLIEKYQKMTGRMHAAFTNQDLNEIMTCIARRQQIIDRIGSGGSRSAPSKDLKALLKQISAVEKECIRSCNSDLDELKSELLKERRKQQGRMGYGVAPERPAARFIDRRVS